MCDAFRQSTDRRPASIARMVQRRAAIQNSCLCPEQQNFCVDPPVVRGQNVRSHHRPRARPKRALRAPQRLRTSSLVSPATNRHRHHISATLLDGRAGNGWARLLRCGRDRSGGGLSSAGYEPASVMWRLSLNRSEPAKKSGQNIPKNRCRTTIAERMMEKLAELPFIGDQVSRAGESPPARLRCSET